ncbi:MAG TPA: heparinase II/III family protein [Dokdonella sp.]|uniref:heparinase II/III family protein n=1 Tax=Dokdonella sp. TaxID=2291710 RepID=UPI0025BA2982|nr:heparinase II/III family protein [Dokdonella sp.]MBX3691676.1 heparinase II/III family protein [Dokdonella sp.]MCW5567174.1 heparinase II/III family protein [Dokdonella sp.]HNR91840.1 heparinase II/III family protein [Dokdonella sp.]
MPRSATSLLACVLAFAVSSAGADGLVLDYGYVDQKSAAYKRFKGWVDQAVGGNPGYEFSALDAVAMFRITGLGRYCDSAVRMVQAEVDEADARIADGQRPAVAGDSYLEVGPRIGALAQTFAACGERLSDGQRAQWTTYADRTIANVWNPKAARWGDTPAAWTGWSIDNPGNNYYYSFIEATMNWALASGNASWLAYLRNEKLPPLKAYYAELPGGGSLEGTGYGAAHMRLFALYRLWKDSTGEDLANASTHLSDSIRFWVHATMPTLDRFAPIGDQSRVSQPELYDYHRRLVLEARISSNDEGARAMASWWLGAISIRQMMHGFNYRYDLLPAGESKTPPAELAWHARGVGRLFARTGWDRDAMWFGFGAGPYLESHAHQDQGAFTLFARDWLAVTENIWTHSGIQQGTEVHNVVRFERDGKTIRQREGTVSKLELVKLDTATGEVEAEADLTPAYGQGSGVSAWQRRVKFSGRHLRVHDTFRTVSGTRAVFQVNVPVKPVIGDREARAGKLRIEVVEPADATLTALDWSTLDAAEFRSGWRVDVEGSGNTFVVELSHDER